MLYSSIIIIRSVFSLIKRVISFFLKTLMSINVFIFYFYFYFFLIKKFEKFKKRVRFKLKVAVRDVLFK